MGSRDTSSTAVTHITRNTSFAEGTGCARGARLLSCRGKGRGLGIGASPRRAGGGDEGESFRVVPLDGKEGEGWRAVASSPRAALAEGRPVPRSEGGHHDGGDGRDWSEATPKVATSWDNSGSGVECCCISYAPMALYDMAQGLDS